MKAWRRRLRPQRIAVTMAAVVRALTTVDELLAALAEGRHRADGEVVDLLAHSLQCAALLADEAPGDLGLQVAGLVHDLGTVLAPGRADTHAQEGAAAVRRLLGTRVADLVAGHDDTKRYLVTTDATYRQVLSPRSVETLHHQGGLLDPPERRAFQRRPDFEALLMLRRADDRAKVPGLAVPGLSRWRDALEAVASVRAMEERLPTRRGATSTTASVRRACGSC